MSISPEAHRERAIVIMEMAITVTGSIEVPPHACGPVVFMSRMIGLLIVVVCEHNTTTYGAFARAEGSPSAKHIHCSTPKYTPVRVCAS